MGDVALLDEGLHSVAMQEPPRRPWFEEPRVALLQRLLSPAWGHRATHGGRQSSPGEQHGVGVMVMGWGKGQSEAGVGGGWEKGGRGCGMGVGVAMSVGWP